MTIEKAIIIIFWSAGVIFASQKIANPSMTTTNSKNKIGLFEKVKGQVQIKPDARIVWRDAKTNQLIAFNDSISTGAHSSAVIHLQNSKPIKIGANSVITIKQFSSFPSEHQEILIDLNIGTLETPQIKSTETKNAHTTNKDLRIKSGEKIFKLPSTTNVFKLTKPQQGVEPQLIASSANIKGMISPATSLTATMRFFAKPLTQNDREIELDQEGHPTNLPIRLEEIKLKTGEEFIIDPEDFIDSSKAQESNPGDQNSEDTQKFELSKNTPINPVPHIIAPKDGWIGWVDQNLEKTQSIEVPIIIGSESGSSSNQLSYKPFIEVSGQSDSPKKKWYGLSTNPKQSITIEIKTESLNTSFGLNNFKEKKISITPGAEFTKRPKLAKEKTTFSLRSLTQPTSGHVSLNIQSWDFTGIKSQVYWQGQGGPISIMLKNPKDLSKLKPLMKQGKFSINKLANFPTTNGIFIIRDHKIIARVVGPIGTLANLNKLKNLLSANFMYRGSASDYLGNDIENFTGEKIYVLNHGRFIGVNQSFLKQNPTVKEFIKSGNSSFFKAPIQRLGRYTESGKIE